MDRNRENGQTEKGGYKMSTILLAEQTMPPAYRLEKRLTELGYSVVSVADTELVGMIKLHPYDAVILSVEVPGDDRDEMFQQIRLFSDAPLLGVCGEKTPEWAEYMRSRFDGGIDPRLSDEVLAEMMEDYLRQAYKRVHNVRLHQYKNLKINNGGIKKAEVNYKKLDLTAKEFMILNLLMCHRDRIHTKAVLYETIWRQAYTGDDNAVKIHISNLRSKLKRADPGEQYIETVWRLGYRMCRH